MSNYEFITSLSVEDLAAFLVTLKHETIVLMQESLAKQGIDLSLISAAFDIRLQDQIEWLEEEYERSEEDDDSDIDLLTDLNDRM